MRGGSILIRNGFSYQGTETIEGLYLDMHHVLEEDSHHVLETDTRLRENFGFSNVKRPRFEELNHESLSSEQGYSLKRRCLSLFIWRSTNNVGRSSDQVGLRTDAFTRMHNLKLLQLNNVEIKGRYANFPGGLRCLTWHGFPLTSIPTEFSLKRLVSLDLRYSKLEQVWKGEMVCFKPSSPTPPPVFFFLSYTYFSFEDPHMNT